jgi:hypothetical protein
MAVCNGRHSGCNITACESRPTSVWSFITREFDQPLNEDRQIRAIARNVKDNLTISGRRGRCLKILPAKQLSEIAIVHACLEATDFQPHLCLSILS